MVWMPKRRGSKLTGKPRDSWEIASDLPAEVMQERVVVTDRQGKVRYSNTLATCLMQLVMCMQLIEKLRKTRDGKPAMPDMIVYRVKPDGTIGQTLIGTDLVLQDDDGPDGTPRGLEPARPISPEWWYIGSVRQCYSTYEAAEKAAAAT